MKTALPIVFLAFASQLSVANVGVFTGYGHSIELTSTDRIKMVREEVTIIPGRGRFHFSGSVPGMDRVEYDCRFELKNLSEDPTKIQVAFPLNSQFLSPPYDRDQKVEDLVAQYRFIVQEGAKIYSLRYTPGDREKKLNNLFLWDLEFKAGETKNLRVSYAMPISMTLASSTKDQSEESNTQPWLKGLETCMLEIFGYVTETGQSWSGSIDEATFRVYTKGFDDYLLERPAMEGVTEEDRAEYLKQMPVWRPVVCRIMEPSGWKMTKQGFWEIQIKDYRADENLLFQYFILSIPQTHEDARRVIKMHGLDVSGRKNLADIMREFNGTKTKNQRIEKFLSNQVWHGQTPLRKISEVVINAVETNGDNKSGAGQPATKAADKPPVKDQPSTPTSKDAPR